MATPVIFEEGTTEGPPLDGIVVADFSRVLAGPLATMILGDLGAEVVKVERPGSGDDTRSWGPPYAPSGESSYYLAVNRNKRSMALDLSDERDRWRARDLSLGADVLVENFKIGTMERFGLGYEDLAEHNPGVIYARITGFGSDAGAELPGYDFLVQAMSGLMSITGEPDGPPLKTGVAIVDVLTGLNTVIGVLAALAERTRSGRGQFLEVSLLSSALSGLVNQASSFLTAGVVPERMGNLHPSIAPYEPYGTATEPLVIAVGNDTQFRSLCESIGLGSAADDPRWRTNSDRVRNRDELRATISEILSQKPRDEWLGRLRDAGVPAGAVNAIDEAFAAAKALGLDPVVEIPRSDGSSVATVANPLRFARTPVSYRRPPPRLGEFDPA